MIDQRRKLCSYYKLVNPHYGIISPFCPYGCEYISRVCVSNIFNVDGLKKSCFDKLKMKEIIYCIRNELERYKLQLLFHVIKGEE